MLVHLFYALPLLTVFIYGLKTPGCSWMLDWTIFFAGAMAQVIVVIMSLLLLTFLDKAKYSMKLTSCCSSAAVLSDPVVPYRSISALPHSLHVQSPCRQVVVCYHPQCAARCCAGSAGPALPQQPRLFYETCPQRTDQQGEEEKLDHTPAMHCRGILHAVTKPMFSGDSRWRTNCIKHAIFQPKTQRKSKNVAV